MSFRVVIGYKNGDMDEVISERSYGRDAIQQVLNSVGSERLCAVWVFLDFEDTNPVWDECSGWSVDPDWEPGCETKVRIYGPNGSAVVKLPWEEAEHASELIERYYPKIWEKMETVECELAEPDAPCSDYDELVGIFQEEP